MRVKSVYVFNCERCEEPIEVEDPFGQCPHCGIAFRIYWKAAVQTVTKNFLEVMCEVDEAAEQHFIRNDS